MVSESIKQDFETLIRDKYASKITIELVVQSMQDIPDAPHTSERTKPWGTGHAVWCARHALDAPFIVINADDFYGQGAIKSAYEHLLHHADNDHCIVSYPLKNTLSEYGTVSRGVCTVEQGKLSKIVEHTKIARKSDGCIVHTCEDGHEIILSPETPVSMNLF